jgi:hypothetical protein
VTACTIVHRCPFPAKHPVWAEGALGVATGDACDHHLVRATAIGWLRGEAPATCGWTYCARRATVVIERRGAEGPERMEVCGDHVVHAEVKDWAVVG